MGLAKPAHLEIIKPAERLDPSLGGTGYVGPVKPATPAELLEFFRGVKDPIVILKLLRESVAFDKRRAVRRLSVIDTLEFSGRRRVRRIFADVVGSTGPWWFVSIDVAHAINVLENPRS